MGSNGHQNFEPDLAESDIEIDIGLIFTPDISETPNDIKQLQKTKAWPDGRTCTAETGLDTWSKWAVKRATESNTTKTED